MHMKEIRKWENGCWRAVEHDPQTISECRERAEKLLKRSHTVVFVSLDPDGRPFAKAMQIAKGSGLDCLRFSTNASSRHVGHIRNNPLATVYFHDPSTFEGVMLTGVAREEPDETWRENIWEDGYEENYSGFDDPDYYILRFDAEWGNYYHNFINVDFDIR